MGQMNRRSSGTRKPPLKNLSTDDSSSPSEGPTQDAEEDKSCQQYQKEFHDCLRNVASIANHMLPMKP